MNGKMFNEKEYKKQWYLKNKQWILKKRKKYQKENMKKLSTYKRKYYLKNKKRITKTNIHWAKNNPEKVKKIAQKCYKKRRKNTPWVFFAYKAKNRCNKSKLYIKLKIQYKLSMEEIQELWFRDEAWLLHQPSLDRKNPDGNYEYSNCRFIEKDINALLARIQNNKKTGKFESTIGK
jgi:hypothetical protein